MNAAMTPEDFAIAEFVRKGTLKRDRRVSGFLIGARTLDWGNAKLTMTSEIIASIGAGRFNVCVRMNAVPTDGAYANQSAGVLLDSRDFKVLDEALMWGRGILLQGIGKVAKAA